MKTPQIVIPVIGDVTAISDRVKDVDRHLQLMWNARIARYEIWDMHPKVHPDHRMVMRIQNIDGSFKPVDARVLADLIEMSYTNRKGLVLTKLDEMAEARDRAWDLRLDVMAMGFGEDLKWIGRAIVPSVAWRERAK